MEKVNCSVVKLPTAMMNVKESFLVSESPCLYVKFIVLSFSREKDVTLPTRTPHFGGRTILNRKSESFASVFPSMEADR